MFRAIRYLSISFLIFPLFGCTNSEVDMHAEKIKEQGLDNVEILLMHARKDDLRVIRRGVGHCIESSGLVEKKVERAIDKQGSAELSKETVGIIGMNIATECAQYWADSAKSLLERRERRDLLNEYAFGVE